VQIDLAKTAVGDSLVADLDLLRALLMVEDFHPLADQGHRCLKEAIVHDDGAVLIDPSAHRRAEIIPQVLGGCPQALHLCGKALKRTLSGR